MRLVIDIGHSQCDKGAHNQRLNLSEWDWNAQVAEALKAMIAGARIIERKSGITQLCNDINACKPEFVLSLHCNAATSPAASGTECLYWHTSKKSKAAAEILQRRLVEALQLPDRGIKARTAADRGGQQLQDVAAPIVIVEPFFLSNLTDVVRAKEVYHDYMAAMIDGIDEIDKLFKEWK